ncbi:hypothetical protein L209DRAFT_170015 [Thermothelomyces heterothallicus CBS 203.75]
MQLFPKQTVKGDTDGGVLERVSSKCDSERHGVSGGSSQAQVKAIFSSQVKAIFSSQAPLLRYKRGMAAFHTDV